MDLRNVLVEKKGRTGILTINRPDKFNAVNSEVIKEIASAFKTLDSDPEVKVIVIRGAGEKAFIAGADIAEMQNITPSQAREFARKGQETLKTFEDSDKIVIAAINGYALGGGLELAMACDMRIASQTAQMGQPEIAIGVIPGWAGTQRLARLVGKTKAKELVLTGKRITAEEAEKIGLINRVVPPEKLIEEVMKTAEAISELGKFSLGAAKHAIDRGVDTTFDKGQELERELFAQCFSDPDQKEGMTAFLEKRKPKFS